MNAASIVIAILGGVVVAVFLIFICNERMQDRVFAATTDAGNESGVRSPRRREGGTADGSGARALAVAGAGIVRWAASALDTQDDRERFTAEWLDTLDGIGGRLQRVRRLGHALSILLFGVYRTRTIRREITASTPSAPPGQFVVTSPADDGASRQDPRRLFRAIGETEAVSFEPLDLSPPIAAGQSTVTEAGGGESSGS